MTKYWLGVVQLDHVKRGTALGIAQTLHGAKSGMQRMSPGDGLIYYSPKTAFEGTPVRQFTAIGIVADEEPWQVDEGDFHPWRRSVTYDDSAVPTPIAPLLDVLDLTRGKPNWGFQLRRGQLEISNHDFTVIGREMRSVTVEP